MGRPRPTFFALPADLRPLPAFGATMSSSKVLAGASAAVLCLEGARWAFVAPAAPQAGDLSAQQPRLRAGTPGAAPEAGRLANAAPAAVLAAAAAGARVESRAVAAALRRSRRRVCAWWRARR